MPLPQTFTLCAHMPLQKGTIAGAPDKPPRAQGPEGRLQTTAHTPGPCGQYAQAYIDWAPSGSESRFVSPREPEVTDRPTPPRGCPIRSQAVPSSLASTTSGGLFARTDRTSKALGHPHPEERESRPPVGSHKSARYVIVRHQYGDGDKRRGAVGLAGEHQPAAMNWMRGVGDRAHGAGDHRVRGRRGTP